MKKLIFICLLAFNFSIAQKLTGTAEYQSKVTLGSFSLKMDTPEMQKEMDEKVKKSLEKKFFLHFNNFESIFLEEEKLDSPNVGGGMFVKKGSVGKPSITYKNIKDKITIKEENFFSKEFLVSDSLEVIPWTITEETKKIGNYTCTKATYTVKVKIKEKVNPDENKNESTNLLEQVKLKDNVITAWFTTEIPVSLGPEKFWGLPGLILEVSDRRTHFLCSKITLNPSEIVKIDKPKRGKKVSREEYVKTVSDKMEEFRSSKGKSSAIQFGN
jgi:GLPGLI family protein